ncbi:MAG: MFS transporter [Opitutales bacterium]|nr:MFS transporter [Opitutales bacterium]
MGCLLPYLVIYLREEVGLRESVIGQLLALSSIAIVISPLIITGLADSRFGGKRLLSWIFLGSTACMLALAWWGTPWAAFVFLGLHMLLFVSVIPLQDGLNFSVQKGRREEGLAETPYHHVRVWGTIGFVVPSLFLFVLFWLGASTVVILYVAAFVGVLGYINTLRLPSFVAAPAVKKQKGKKHGVPTMEAIRVFANPRMVVIGAGLFLAHLGSAAYFGFYPLYLTREIGLSERSAGLVFNIGVVVEIVFILGFGWALRKLGLRRLLVIAMALTALRMFLLAAFPTVGMAIVSQVFHGMVVIALQVGPVLFLNSLAGDHFRSSIQGFYTMAIAGSSRVVGHLWAGSLAESSLLSIYFYAGLLTTVSCLMLWLFLPNQENTGEIIDNPHAGEGK